MNSLPPGVILIAGAPLLALLPRYPRRLASLLLPILSFAHLLTFDLGHTTTLEIFGETLTPIRFDGLARVWGIVFHIAAFLGALYAFRVDRRSEQIAAPFYAGAAIAAVFAGDLLSLFVHWELTAVSSVFLVLAGRSGFGDRANIRASVRYLLIQVLSGVLLLAGAVILRAQGNGLAFNALDPQSAGGALILAAFGIKAAFPLLHNWLQDSYPRSTPSGAVFLSAFSTKLAIYALARGYAGTDILIPIGATMAAFPIFFAVIENDLRRVLSYSLNNQLGFMVVGIGIGSELALNGTAAHAFAHILYKGLLFMSMGAVLHRVGTVKASELGGLWKSMPWTTVFCIIGALSISAMPLFSGFTSKSLILSAVGNEHLTMIFLVLMFASAGVVDHSGIKVPFFAFFAHDQGHRPKEAPIEMLLAMGLAAALCIGIGVYPKPLYDILPYAVDYQPYTASHVIAQLQLLLFAALAFVILFRTKIYPPEVRSTNLDFDWTYRKAAPALLRPIIAFACSIGGLWIAFKRAVLATAIQLGGRLGRPDAVLGRTWGTSSSVLWIAFLLVACLILYYR